MNNITYNYISDFIRDLQPRDNQLIFELENEAHETDVPIISLEVKSFLTTILTMVKPKYILEIGTAIGYSSIVMSQYLQKGGKIITIERNPVMLQRAYHNIDKASLNDKIEIIEGTAEEILPNLNKKFDFVFMDASKGQYDLFFQYCIDLLNDDGVLIADNVLHKGMVAKSRYEIPRRQRTIHKRMRNFIWDVLNNDKFKSSLLPIGDGIALCYKKGDKCNEQKS